MSVASEAAQNPLSAFALRKIRGLSNARECCRATLPEMRSRLRFGERLRESYPYIPAVALADIGAKPVTWICM